MHVYYVKFYLIIWLIDRGLLFGLYSLQNEMASFAKLQNTWRDKETDDSRVPGGPGNPGFPSDPGRPSDPWTPGRPGEPGSPFGPGRPSKPFSPFCPFGPGNP